MTDKSDTRTKIGPETKAAIFALTEKGKVVYNTYEIESHDICNNGDLIFWEIKVTNEFLVKPIFIRLTEYEGQTRLSAYREGKRINGYINLWELCCELPRNFKL